MNTRIGMIIAAIPAIALLIIAGKFGVRFQTAPAYVAGGLVLAAASWGSLSAPTTRVAIAVSLVFFVLAIVLSRAFPSVDLPLPSGSYPVATTIRHLVDPNRKDTFRPGPPAQRELMIQIWYPAVAASRRKTVAYLPDRRSMISFMESTMASTDTHALVDAPLSPSPQTYPLLIYSPSWHGNRNQNTILIEELASRGFIVVAIDHPYSSGPVVFPDGRIARPDSSEFWDLSSDKALEESIARINQHLEVRAEDVRFVLSEMEQWNTSNSGDLFSGRIDMGRVGVFGYSFGGTVAAQVCYLDSRFKAGLDIGGSLFGEVAERGVEQPFMFIDDDTSEPSPEEIAQSGQVKRRYLQLVARDFRIENRIAGNCGGYRVTIRGSEHSNFSDWPLFAPRIVTEAGRIDPLRAIRLTSDYTLAFFDKYLNHSNESLLDLAASPYPDVSSVAYPLHNEHRATQWSSNTPIHDPTER